MPLWLYPMKPLPGDNLNLWLSLNLSMSFTRHFGRNILNGRLKHFERGLKINTAAIQRTTETEEQGRQVLVNPTQLKYLKLDVSICFWEECIWEIFVELMLLNQYLEKLRTNPIVLYSQRIKCLCCQLYPFQMLVFGFICFTDVRKKVKSSYNKCAIYWGKKKKSKIPCLLQFILCTIF